MGTPDSANATMLTTSVVLLALIVLSVNAASRYDDDDDSSSQSTSYNSHRKQFIAENIANFNERLATAVSKALVENNPNIDVRPFLKTYGIDSDRSFDKTFELLNALVSSEGTSAGEPDEETRDYRKRAALSSSSSSSSSSDDISIDSRVAQLQGFVEGFTGAQKKQFRKAVLKQALIKHLEAGRERHHADDVEAIFQDYEDWAEINQEVLGHLPPATLKRLKKDLWITSSD